MVKTFKMSTCLKDWYNCPILDILTVLYDMEIRNEEYQMTPSNFLKEVQLSTEQRYEKLIRPAYTGFHTSQKYFKIIPEIIVYQNFVQGLTYSVQLTLMNIHNVSKSLRIEMAPSTCFSLRHTTESICSKLAPGLKFILEVRFSPMELKDYKHKITFITSDVSFEVPIIAIGPRPLLDLPDKIVLPTTAINIEGERTIMIRNIGQILATFIIESSKGFFVENSRQLLKPNETSPLTIRTYPKTLGVIMGELKVTYETGEVLYVKLEGACIEADVRMDSNKLVYDDVYIGLTQEKVVTLQNDSEFIIDYRWTSHECASCEGKALAIIKEKFDDMKLYELDRANKLGYYEICDREMNEEIYERILTEEKKLCDLSTEPVYSNKNFTIAPTAGQLWPKSQENFSIIYTPLEVDVHKSLAFLDITGKSSRSHLQIVGTACGPDIVINLEELDAQNIYIGSVHRYQVIFKNTGPIPGTIQYNPTKSTYGGEFKATPPTCIVQPEEVQSVYVEFFSLTRGKFVEKICFYIMESQKELSFIMCGNIVCPLLNFDVTNLDFGDISVGQTKKFQFNLENNTQVSIEFRTCILASSSASQYSTQSPEDFLCDEFSCSSTEGVVQPYSKLPYTVEATPRAAVDKGVELAIYMWEARQHSRTVYLRYKAHVPLIQCLTPIISIKSMFITQPYYRTLTLDNKSDYMGHLMLSTTNTEEGSTLDIQLEKYDIFVEAWESYDIRMVVKIDIIGDFKAKISGLFRGAALSFGICEVLVISRGPCIDSDLTDTNLGKLKTLTLTEKSFILSNDSPITATVTVAISGPNITAGDPVIIIPPEQSVETSLRIYGTSPGRFKTNIRLEIEGADPDVIVFTGEFIGGSISTLPHLEPFYDIGTISTVTNFMQEVKFFNEGKVAHCISFKEYETVIIPSVTWDNGRPFFIISQNQFLLGPGKQQLLFIDCYSKFPCRVVTRFVCNAKKQSRKTLITRKMFDFKLIVTFEAPHVTLCKKFLEFRIDVGSDLAVLEDDITLMNQSKVILNMELSTEDPFYFVINEKLYLRQDVTLDPGEHLNLLVRFNPELIEKRIQLRKGFIKIQYLMHPTMEKFPMFGIVNYPNVAFEPSVLDLQCIPVGHTGYWLVTLRNLSPLQANYAFEIKESSFSVTPIEFQPKDCEYLSRVSSYDSLADLIHTIEEEHNELAMAEESFEYVIEESSIVNTKTTSLLDSEECLEIAKRTLENEDNNSTLNTLLAPLIDEYKKDMYSLDPVLQKILKTDDTILKVRHILDLVPRCGSLAPNESHIISISVNPPANTQIAATVTCHVEGGATTDLDILAKSGNVYYCLKTDIIDFGIIHFNQISETTFTLENIGYAKLPFSIRYSNSGNTMFQAEPGWLAIVPGDGLVTEHSSIDINVKYFPGIPGYFETIVSLEISFLNPVKLTIKGYAILSQFFFDYPRPLTDELNELSYSAIADITYPRHCNCHEAYTTQVQQGYNDWEYVRYKSHYPSVRDIAMAVERKIIQSHLENNYDLVSFKYANPSAVIPDLILPPYVIDIGYIILNTERDVLINPFNYSETPNKLYWLRVPRKCLENGFSMVFQKGQPGPFLMFKPTTKQFPESNTEVVGHFSCVVAATMKIDFEVRAIVTVPSLIFKHNSIDFGKVQVGFCLRKSVLLQNNGAVTCSYKILIQSSSERNTNIFFTMARDGVVDAGGYAKIEIFFQPQSYTRYEWRLVLAIEANKIPMKIPLRGMGVMPELLIKDEKITFEPTLPYSIENVKYFRIINQSQFPIEISFTDFDKELDKEGAIIKILLFYYNVKKLFIPPRQVGAPLPQPMLDLYEYLLEHLRQILRRKIKREYFNVLKKFNSTEKVEQIELHLARDSTVSVDTFNIPDPLEDKTFEEIQTLFIENIGELRLNDNSEFGMLRKGSIFEIDVGATSTEIIDTNEIKETKEGFLVFFHGAPYTDYVFAANKIARSLHIEVMSIDQLIIESLVRNEVFSANKVNQTIQSTFEEIASDSDLIVPDNYDVYDILKARVVLILARTDPKRYGDREREEDEPRKLIIDKDKKRCETFLNLPLDLFYEMLADSLAHHPAGLIVQALQSDFINKPKLALIGLLKGVGNIQYIHGIYFALSCKDYIAKRREDELKDSDISQHVHDTLKRILNMDQDEFDNITPHELNIYKTLYLKPRKEETARRLHQRQTRINTGRSFFVGKSRMDYTKSLMDAKVKQMQTDVKNAIKFNDKKSEIGRANTEQEAEEIEQCIIDAEVEAIEISNILEGWNRLLGEIEPPSHHRFSASRVREKTGKESAFKTIPVRLEDYVEPEERKVEIKYLTEEEMAHRRSVGVPLWYIRNAHYESHIPYAELITQFLAENEEVTESLYQAYIASLGNYKESEQLYTVLADPRTDRYKNSSSEFVLFDCQNEPGLFVTPSYVNEVSDLEIPKVQSLSKSISSTKRVSSSTSHQRSSASLLSKKKKKSSSATKTSAKSITTISSTKFLVPRRIMQPNECLTYEVNFFPESCAVFNYTYFIEVVTLPIPFKIYLEGKSDIPRIFFEPSMIFSKVLPYKMGHDYVVAYFEKEEVFHMGAVATQPTDSRVKCLIVEDRLNLINNSYLSCELNLDFLDYTSDFSLEATTVRVEPNNSQFVAIRGHPVYKGNIHTSLIITTQNNPRVNCVKISEIGTKFVIDINPHTIFFERVLINRVVNIDVELKNLSLIGATWDINFKTAAENYGISETSGYIKPLGSNIITFTYEAHEFKIVPVEEIEIKFYDKYRHCEEPIHQEIIQLSAEVVEVDLEYEPDVQLGDIKIGQLFTSTFHFNNKSKFELKYNFMKLEYVKENNEMAIVRKSTVMDPNEGLIKPNDVTKVTIKFKTNIPVEFRCVPILKCVVTDPLVKREVTNFVLKVTGKVFSSGYKICPSEEVIFSPQFVDTEVKKDIVIFNTGKYSFTFMVLSIDSIEEEFDQKNGGLKKKRKKGKSIVRDSSSSSSSDKTKRTKSSRVSLTTKKTKSRTKPKSAITTNNKKGGIKQTVLKQGIFTIVPSTGVVQPHSETYIQITCKPKKMGIFTEKVSFFISGVTGKWANGEIFTLQGSACVPDMDFSNLADIFKQHMIVDTFEDALCSKQLFASSVFILVDRLFYFCSTCLNLEREARIKIRNQGDIGAQVHATITGGNGEFRVEPDKQYIESFRFEMFTVFFKPSALQIYEGKIQFTVEMVTQTLEINLLGEGALPIVRVIEPPLKEDTNTYEVDYQLVLLGSKIRKSIVLNNPGMLDSKVVLGIIGDTEKYLSFHPECCSSLEAICGRNLLEDVFKRTALVDVNLNETVTIFIDFEPKESIVIEDCYVEIFVTNNPYEVYKVKILGRGYKEDVILELLDSFVAPEYVGLSHNPSIASTPSDDVHFNNYIYTLLSYDLNMGYKPINQLNKRCFKIRNISDEHTYRFVFTTVSSNLTFIPSIGHLKPLACKDIIITFFSSETVAFKNEVLLCKIVKIEYINPIAEPLSWDERQHCTMWVPVNFQSTSKISDDDIESASQHTMNVMENTKVIHHKEEPLYNVLPHSAQAIRILLNIVVDYCWYDIDSDEINFPNTTMFQSTKYKYTVRNPSSVPVEIDWQIRLGTYPRKSAATTSVRCSAIKLDQVTAPKFRPQTCYLGRRDVGPLTGNERFLNYGRPQSSTSSSSLFSSTYNMDIASMHSYCDSDPIPLSVTPHKAVISPESSYTFEFTFSPFTPLDYLFDVMSEIPNLKPDVNRLEIVVRGVSLLPLYHFKIDQSDYIAKRRGNRQSCDILPEEGTKVLEFESIGFGIPVTKQFMIINPTGEKFSFRWEKSIKERHVALFQCATPEGEVMKGRSAEAVFNFIAQKAGTFEMFYYFMIEKYDLRVMFLLVGHAREPCVYFQDNGKVLKPTVLGIDIHDVIYLINKEDLELTYKINNSSLYHEGRLHKIGVEPLKGVLQPKSVFPVKIFFRPTRIGNFSYSVEFQVERIEKPLIMTISAMCYNLEPTVKLMKEFNTTDLMIDSENIVQMPVLVSKKSQKNKFFIGNVGKVGFYYKWEMVDQFIDDFVTIEIEPREGYVKTNTEIGCVVYVKPVKFMNKKHIRLLLKVIYGPSIPITFVCTTCKTKLKFSETMHDYGACLSQKHNAFNNEWTLEISNNDYINYIVQIGNQNFNHLTIVKRDTLLSPKQTMKIQFYFHPKEITKYNTFVNIMINDKTYPINILGEGVSMEVDLLDIKNKFLNFGAIPLGKYSKKVIQIINKTKCMVSIYFELYHRLPIFVKTTKHLEPDFEHPEIKPSDTAIRSNRTDSGTAKKVIINKLVKTKSKRSASKFDMKSSRSSNSSGESKRSRKRKESRQQKRLRKSSVSEVHEEIRDVDETPEEKQRRLINSAIRIRPLKWLKLYPMNSAEFTITFMPSARMSVFQEQIFCQVEDTVIPMCSIKGSCIAPQFSLYKNKVAFGTVIIGSSNTYSTKLVNSGDVGGKFKWSWKTQRPDAFTIVPMEGYSSPGTCTTFKVLFQPAYVQCSYVSSAKITIENYKINFDLDLTGSCINLPNPEDILRFSGPVRESHVKKFTVRNTTPEPWKIKPCITGDYFQVDDVIVVDAKSSYDGEVTYNPMTMTIGNKLHEGKLFLPLPEGQGILYDLIGESLRPTPIEIIEKTISSKAYNIIPLDVYNWMKITQQFTVVNQIDQPDDEKKILYKLTGNALIDVPPITTKKYKWVIYTLNEGKLDFKVKFRNENTKEYLCYELKLHVVKCEALDTFVLNTCARQQADFQLKLENPLGEETTYKLHSPCPDLHFVKEATVRPYTEFEVLIEYKPLYPAAEFTTIFEAVSPTLGTFPYNFVLSANTAEAEATVTIEAPLGQKSYQHTYVYNHSHSVAEFTSKLDNTEFSVDKHVVVQAGDKGVIEIGFEPSDLGGVHSKLSFTSPTLGLFIYPLYGIGVSPKPQGPFIVKDNFQTFIPFKNPFINKMTFNYKVDKEGFLLKMKTEVIKPRSTTRINVSCEWKRDESLNDLPSKLTGKLIITCAEEGYTQIEWVMYLQSE